MRTDLSRTVAIVGAAESDEIGLTPNKSPLQHHAEAAYNALADAGLSIKDVDGLFTAGYSTLVLTVDVPVAGARHRDKYNGLTFPPSLSARTLLRIAAKPRWLFDALTTEPLAFESLGAADEIMDLIDTVFDPSVTLADIEWLRDRWPGAVVIKGVQRVDDAKDIASVGVDGIALSNHGGRQLDRAPAPLDLLPEVVDAVGGGTEIYLDGGVRSGADIAAAVASVRAPPFSRDRRSRVKFVIVLFSRVLLALSQTNFLRTCFNC